MRRPIVIVPACLHGEGAFACHTVQNKYLTAVLVGARAMPLVLPAIGEASDIEALLATADGLMLTGSPSNVDPALFGEAVLDPSLPLDRARDSTVMPLIRAVLKRGIPLLAICRGFQELNVALGGSLHQAVHLVPGLNDHRENEHDPLDKQYGPAHRVVPEADGQLRRILGGADAIMVNSLHGQGIARLADGLAVEGRADDGLIEAYSVPAAPGFALALQWHPEWQVGDNPVSMKLFKAFGDACRAWQAKKHPVK
jgi:putative glutamine amidotransferase